MSRYKDAFEVEGVIIEALPKLRFRVELPNGHRLLAHVPKRLQAAAAALAPGDRVTMEVSPFDLSKGMVTNLKLREV